jgi:hypothetical protein
MPEQKVFINNDNMATFVCPKCKKATTADVHEYKDINKAVRIQHTCACGHSHTVLLERRQFYRKYVSIPGFYTIDGEDVKRPMTVKDLSRSGLKLKIEEEANLKIGDKLNVEFQLDNPQKTLIKKEVRVKTVMGLNVGTAFLSRDPKNPIDKAYDVAIGFYTFT